MVRFGAVGVWQGKVRYGSQWLKMESKAADIRVIAGHVYVRLDFLDRKNDWLMKLGAVMACDSCGREFYRTGARVRASAKRKAKGTFCSRKCAADARPDTRPGRREFDYEQIVAMRAAGMMLWEIAAKIGCSMETVNKVVYRSQEGKVLVRTGQGNWSKRSRMAKRGCCESV